MENENELLDSQNETENLDSQIEVEEVDVEALKQEKEKLAEQNKQLFERAKKAELELKKAKPVEQPKEETPKKEGYSLEDTIAIINDKVTEKEDIETIKKFAKLENVSISEALKSPIVKTILSTRAEERKTAQATNTAVSRKGASKVSGEDLLEKFNRGDVPEKEEDQAKLIEARWSPKK